MTAAGEDHELVEQAKKDPAAFGALFEKYYEPVFGYTFRRVLDWDLAKDIVSLSIKDC